VQKFIVLLVLGFVAYGLFKNYARRGLPREQQSDPVKNNEDMVKCVHCGVHMPLSEATLSKGNYFCSNEHRLMHNNGRSG
jgi:uncharacterized protein